MKKFLLVISFFLWNINLLAQAPDTIWTKTFGGEGDDSGYSLTQTPDGGYLIVGNTNSMGAGDLDIWILKVDSSGNQTWQKIYGGKGRERAYSIEMTFDGGYIIGGQTASFGEGAFDIWLLKINSKGDTLWTKTYGGVGHEELYSVKETNDRGYIILGWTTTFSIGNRKAWLIKTDSLGNKLWDKSFGKDKLMCKSLCLTSNNEYLVSGALEPGRVWLIKVSTAGNLIWEKVINESEYGRGDCVIQNKDGQYILGITKYYDENSSDIEIAGVDTSGNVIWEKTIETPALDGCNSLIQDQDGNYIINATTISNDKQNSDILLVSLAPGRDTVWTMTIGGKYQDNCVQFIEVQGNEFILCGETNSYSAGDWNLWLLKLAIKR